MCVVVGGESKLIRRDGTWCVGSSWTPWIKCENSSDYPPEDGWLVRSGPSRRDGKEFTLDSTLRLRFGCVGCQVLTISSAGPILQIFGKKFLGKFYRREDAYKTGRPMFQNDYGMLLSMINLFGRVHYWTVHEAGGGDQDEDDHPSQCFRLNLRRNICPAIARGSDSLFLYRVVGMTEGRVVEDVTLSVTCDWHRLFNHYPHV